jgi:transcriptional regulator with XRE-family HTH domain
MKDTEWQQIVRAVGRTARDLRRLLGWSQQRVADLAITSQGAISRLESGTAEALPLHTAVIVFRALAVGAQELNLPLSREAHALSMFSDAFHPGFALMTSSDPELVQLLRVFHRLPAARRPALLRLVEATVDLFRSELDPDVPDVVDASEIST